jgi:hypothetical protein
LENQDADAFTLLIADKPASAAENWTAACEAARGEYIKLLCADDYLLDGGLGRQIEAAAAHPDAVLISSRRRIVNHDGATVFRRRGLRGIVGRVAGTKAARKAALSGTNPFGEPSTVLFRADALRKSLPWGADFPYVTDLQMYVRVLQLGSFVGLRSTDAAFRLSNTSWSREIGNKQLTQYRQWIRSLVADGTLRRGPVTLVLSESRYFVIFIARRVASFLARQLARRNG